MRIPFTVRAALIAAAALLATQPLQAQTPAEQEPPDVAAPATQTPTVQIEDKKVDQFAAAFVAVQQIQAQAAQQLNSTTDEKQATQVKSSAEKQMIAAVEREGLAVEEFNQIADLMATDLALRSRVVEKVEKRRKG